MIPLIVPNQVTFTTKNILRLPQPSQENKNTLFYLNKCQLFQLFRQQELNSCFYADRVIQDGRVVLLTPFHPLFILIPVFQKKSSHLYQAIEDLMYDPEIPDLSRLLDLEGMEECIQNICLKRVQESIPGQYFYKFDPEKTLEWIVKRAQNLMDKYDSFEFFKNSKPMDSKTESDVNLLSNLLCKILVIIWIEAANTCRIMSDCLDKEWLSKLKSVLKVTENSIDSSLYYIDHHISKKSNDPHPLEEQENSKTKKKGVKLSAAQKSLSKANTKGMKSIKSFFSPK